LIAWWKRGSIQWKRDVLPALPFFAVAIALGLLVSWLEKAHAGAHGQPWQIPFVQRILIAGRALWFYAGKLAWPFDLCFIYPRWELNASSAWQWTYVLAAGVLMVTLWLARRRIGRGPAAAVFFYAGNLLPLLGFLNAYFMIYSFVSDHWVYLPSLGLIALAAAGIARILAAARLGWLVKGVPLLLLLFLASLTWKQSHIYQDPDSLWADTLAKNPKAWMAHHNVALRLQGRGKLDEAAQEYRIVLELHPRDERAHNNLGVVLAALGRRNEAVRHYQAAIDLDPGFADPLGNLASLFAGVGDLNQAVAYQRKAVELDSNSAEMWFSLNAL
jgi:tetratricopeptide (TPR) repeat protein